jgi:ABC-type oligopeptide transport system ATPase subunit
MKTGPGTNTLDSNLLGTIISGSLSEGFAMRINPDIDMHRVRAGRFVAITTPQGRFFSLITDLKLDVTNPDILLFPPAEHETLLHDFLAQKDMYAVATLRPLITLTDGKKLGPVKTIPRHFSPVLEVTHNDVTAIFGDEQEPTKKFFNVGNPLDMEAPVCIDLDRLTERSTGIFGKTGTGKTFLTRLLLAGLIHRDKSVAVIFDMHSEYGLEARTESKNQQFVKGLKTLFSNKVAIFSLDPKSTRMRGGSPDVEVKLTYQSVEVEDILSLQEELNLHPTACEAAHAIAAKHGDHWLSELLTRGTSKELEKLANEVGAHPESIAALYRKLRKIEYLPFFEKEANSFKTDVIQTMMDYIDKGISIIIEFGNYTSTFSYLLIANIITRRLHTLYSQKTEKYLGSRLPQDEPKKMIIVIEEAHKFLNPQAARQTIFGIIAREMRKYYVSLLVVDQRPSGIDPEVLSQLGTKIIAQLNDERDIQAVLTGVGNAQQLRSVLASLESKKQVLLLGHAVTMPVVIESRPYDEAFYKTLQPFSTGNINQFINELF